MKPANIMRTRRGRLYLIDFGIARHFRPEKERDTGPLGSPGYAAPEQYGRAQSTEQTDIYGLGVTLHTLLTGRDPLDDDPAVPPTQLPGKAGQELQRLLEVMQATDTADRPRNMREVQGSLCLSCSLSISFLCSGRWYSSANACWRCTSSSLLTLAGICWPLVSCSC